LTLTSYGMVRRSRPPGHDASSVVALWKDPERGTREIALESGAHGVVLTLCGARATRRSADGRWPVDTGTRYFDAAVHHIEAEASGSCPTRCDVVNQTPCVLEIEEVTVLASWAEGLAEALAHAPGGALALLGDALGGSPWRTDLRIPEPPHRV